MKIALRQYLLCLLLITGQYLPLAVKAGENHLATVLSHIETKPQLRQHAERLRNFRESAPNIEHFINQWFLEPLSLEELTLLGNLAIFSPLLLMSPVDQPMMRKNLNSADFTSLLQEHLQKIHFQYHLSTEEQMLDIFYAQAVLIHGHANVISSTIQALQEQYGTTDILAIAQSGRTPIKLPQITDYGLSVLEDLHPHPWNDISLMGPVLVHLLSMINSAHSEGEKIFLNNVLPLLSEKQKQDLAQRLHAVFFNMHEYSVRTSLMFWGMLHAELKKDALSFVGFMQDMANNAATDKQFYRWLAQPKHVPAAHTLKQLLQSTRGTKCLRLLTEKDLLPAMAATSSQDRQKKQEKEKIHNATAIGSSKKKIQLSPFQLDTAILSATIDVAFMDTLTDETPCTSDNWQLPPLPAEGINDKRTLKNTLEELLHKHPLPQCMNCPGYISQLRQTLQQSKERYLAACHNRESRSAKTTTTKADTMIEELSTHLQQLSLNPALYNAQGTKQDQDTCDENTETHFHQYYDRLIAYFKTEWFRLNHYGYDAIGGKFHQLYETIKTLNSYSQAEYSQAKAIPETLLHTLSTAALPVLKHQQKPGITHLHWEILPVSVQNYVVKLKDYLVRVSDVMPNDIPHSIAIVDQQGNALPTISLPEKNIQTNAHLIDCEENLYAIIGKHQEQDATALQHSVTALLSATPITKEPFILDERGNVQLQATYADYLFRGQAALLPLISWWLHQSIAVLLPNDGPALARVVLFSADGGHAKTKLLNGRELYALQNEGTLVLSYQNNQWQQLAYTTEK